MTVPVTRAWGKPLLVPGLDRVGPGLGWYFTVLPARTFRLNCFQFPCLCLAVLIDRWWINCLTYCMMYVFHCCCLYFLIILFVKTTRLYTVFFHACVHFDFSASDCMCITRKCYKYKFTLRYSYTSLTVAAVLLFQSKTMIKYLYSDFSQPHFCTWDARICLARRIRVVTLLPSAVCACTPPPIFISFYAT